MTKDEALKLALEALTNAYWPTESDLMPAHNSKECAEAITAIKEALAQPEQEPLAWISTGTARMIHWTADKPAYNDDWVPLYTTPPPCPTCEALARTVMMDQRTQVDKNE